ncbi:MAG TPA: hypothetical protein VJT72_02050 [Pseudonocardiaceae bacterium]|nr:hypothetical protein [Pseudonocardiaceae bacterium]
MLTQHGCKIAPSTYYACKKRQLAPSPRSVRDEGLKEQIKEVYEANYRVYGARKVWCRRTGLSGPGKISVKQAHATVRR